MLLRSEEEIIASVRKFTKEKIIYIFWKKSKSLNVIIYVNCSWGNGDNNQGELRFEHK